MTEHILFWTMLVTFVTYVGYIIYNFGIQPSISESYYRLAQNKKMLFTLFCYGIAFPAMMLGVILATSMLMFLAGACIALVGATSRFKSAITKEFHIMGAILGIGFAMLSIIFDFHMWYVAVAFLLSTAFILLFHKRIFNDNNLWWIEKAAFAAIIYVLGIWIYF